MFNLSKKASSWSLALALVAGVGSAGTALPVSAEEGMLEEIVVTGSRIRRSNADSPTPMVVLGRDVIDGVGTTNIGQLLEGLPSIVASTNQGNSNFFTNSFGINASELRFLGQARTLTLINGKRFVSGSAPSVSYGVDMSTIPTAMVDRIEIITGGASAVYGSDAIAGVINIIMKNDFEGVSIDIQSGVSAEGDRETVDVDVAMGGNFDRGNAYVTFGYSDEEGLMASDRNQIDLAGFDTNGDGFDDTWGFLGSSGLPGGQWAGRLSDGSLADFSTGPGSEATSDRFNRGSSRALYIPLERRYARAGITYEINDDLTANINIGFNETIANSNLEPVFFDINTQVFKNDVGKVADLDIATSLVMPEALKQALLSDGHVTLTDLGNNRAVRRMTDVGDRASQGNRATAYADGTVTYTINDDWSLEGYATWGRTRSNLQVQGNIDTDRARLALDVELVDGIIQCKDAGARLSGCVPFNPWVPAGTMTAAEVDYLTAAASYAAETEQFVLGANLSGETPFALPGGNIGVAAGVEWREEKGQNNPSGLIQQGSLSGNAIRATKGQYDVTDYYGEVRFPIIDQLTIEAAVRLSDNSIIGDTFTYKLGFDAPVLDWLRFRGTISESVRAPNIADLFDGGGETFRTVTDLCDEATTTSTAPGHDNCRTIGTISDRIASTGSFTLTQVELQSTGGFTGGNPDVQEETAESFTIGAVINVPFVEGLVVAIDWYDIEVDDAITTTSRDEVIRRCFTVTSSFDSTCGGRVTRDTAGALVSVDSGTANENKLETAGLDIDVSYNTDISNWSSSLRGNINVNLIYSYLDHNDIIGIVSGTKTTQAGEVLTPDHRWNLQTDYTLDDLTVTWKMRYWDDVVDSDDPATETGNFGSLYELDSVLYHDLRAAYNVTDNINIYFGIINVADEDPPILGQFTQYGSTGANTVPEAYDVIGRRYYAGVSIDL